MKSTFWSRRQAAVAEEARAEQEAVQAAEVAEAETALAERDDAEILEELGLPEPEALDSPEGVREFLNSAVPQRLKTRALRRLWRLNPVLANLDGLIDYGEDYTDAANVVENLQTAYQVGKGMLAHIEALAAEAEAKETEAHEDKAGPEDPVDRGDIDEAPSETFEEEAPVAMAFTPEPAAVPAADMLPEQEVPSLPASGRRMRFQFETTV